MHKAAIIKPSGDGCQIRVTSDTYCDKDVVMTSKYIGKFPKLHEGNLTLRLCSKHATMWFVNGIVWKKVDA